jgi:hypothetical protein
MYIARKMVNKGMNEAGFLVIQLNSIQAPKYKNKLKNKQNILK